MFRLTVLLCVSMFMALLVAGKDNGQLRPGLAKAAAEAKLHPLTEAPVKTAAPAPAAIEAPKAKKEVTATKPPKPAKPEATLASAVITPPREVVQVLEDPVFTLSALPTERLQDAVEPQALPVAAEGTEGEIMYVTASSVNVREGPSTDAAVLGKLGAGEAALVITDVDGEWARIVIQGDGMEGYVALRFLSASAP